MTKEQWIAIILGIAVGTYAMSSDMRFLAGLTMVVTGLAIIYFSRKRGGGGGGWWFRDDDFDPSPIDPDPGGIELSDRNLADLVNAWSVEVKRENV